MGKEREDDEPIREARVRAARRAIAVDDARDPIARRDFLLRMGAAFALAGVSACTRAEREEIVPYVVQPPEVTPGKPRWYASALVHDGYARGVLVESHEGRPTKIEGNPEHPASLGATSAFDQASVLALYDPERLRAPKKKGEITSWDAALAELMRGRFAEEQGRGLHLLLEPTSSPTIASLLDVLRARLPHAAIWFHAPAAPVNAWEGARMAFGKVLEPRFALADADVVVALDSDLLREGPQSLVVARAFAERRDPKKPMNRLYAVEPLLTVTGAAADERLAVTQSDVLAVAAAIAIGAGVRGVPPALAARAEPHRRFIDALVRDLLAHRGRSAIVAGAAQPPIVHALAYAIDEALGNVGKTVTFAPSAIVEAGAPSFALAGLRDALASGAVDTLVVCGANPAYTAPDLPLARARVSACLALHDDETCAASTFALPEAHPLESWGDARAFDGTTTVLQPLIEPIWGGRTTIDVLAALAGRAGTAHDLVRARFKDDREWRRALKRGLVDDTAIAPADVTLAAGDAFTRAKPPTAPALELVSPLDPAVHDGRYANVAWLLELPQPITTLTWTNAALLAPETARAHGIEDGDELELRAGEHTVHAPAIIVRGQAPDVVGLTRGWGRTRGAPLAHGRGANAYLLAGEIAIAKTGKKIDLPLVQPAKGLEGRDEHIAQHATLAEWHTDRFQKRVHKRALTLYADKPDAPKQWAMAVDLAKCTGCGSCVVACQAENNVPTVGPDGVFMGRHMHWLRIDQYVAGDEVVSQPMLCQHCEKAPCEYVCPVNATVHSPDGLNEMVYNRCVGTRFCSNNCPYKVRRFNWFDFHQHEGEVERLVHNPDVTVRERGVMEKCSFCVQRIREHEIAEARGEHPKPVVTACAQACATKAIVFGTVDELRPLRESERAFGALEDLGTEPRVRYLARITNPNPELGS